MLSSPEKAETYSEIFKIDNTKFKAQHNQVGSKRLH